MKHNIILLFFSIFNASLIYRIFLCLIFFIHFGAIQVLRNADGGGGGVSFSGKKCYDCVMFNVISVTRGWVGVQFPGKQRYITLEWPLPTKVGEISKKIQERWLKWDGMNML